MNENIYSIIRKNPKFKELVTRRTRFAMSLSFTVWAIFYGFIMLVAFNPELIGQALGSGFMTVGIALGLFQFIFFWLLIWWYVRRANGEFDELNDEIVREATRELKE